MKESESLEAAATAAGTAAAAVPGIGAPMAAAGAALGMSATAKLAFERFRVELEKLRQTAGQLQGEVDSMYGVAERMSANPDFGDTGIGGVGALAPRHGEVAKQMQKLLTDIHGGIAAGEEALVEVAERYAAADARGEKRMKDVGERVMEEQNFDDEGEDGEAQDETEPSVTTPGG